MTATTKLPSRVRAAGLRRFGWAGAAVLAVLAPKCVGCLGAYLGIGAALGLTRAGAELCGVRVGAPMGAIAWLAAMVGIGAWFACRRRPGSGNPRG